ncbi:MAG: carboxypeptidase regulatory-like domain-containing protein [Deltaproteobacteria bacterium]|nr:carboxypeptidase regulatory-like domain-containing protein [Deltaproteobacteria bacterium]
MSPARLHRPRILAALALIANIWGCEAAPASPPAEDAGPGLDAPPEADGGADGGGNLLCNPGFEQGTSAPECWRKFPEAPQDITYTWESGVAHTGSRSVSVTGTHTGLGMWQQVVPVRAGTVYLLSGHVGFANIEQGSQCNLQLVFRDQGNQLVQMIDYPRHDGAREFALDFPTGLKVRAPAGSATVEVNLFLRGKGKALFDDVYFAPSPIGAIAGSVTGAGGPLAGAKVSIWGDPWGKVYEALSDASGSYRLDDVPVAFPRYILLAGKAGYQTRAQGRVAVVAGGSTTVDFDLAAGADPKDDLRVKFGSLDLAHFAPAARIPAGAAIPADETGYPDAVKPFLQPDEYIDSDHPDVAALAAGLRAGLPADKRSDTREVAWTVYEWVSKNIDHDGVYSVEGGGLDQPYQDVTSGIWQTISGEGWAWGKDFYDWTYRPHELLAVQGGICVEHAILVSALLRNLWIPARSFSGALEFWAQTPDRNGAWVGMSTTGGRTGFREHGDLGSGFEVGRLAMPPVTPKPVIHEDWDAENPGIWRERHPWGEGYEATAAGLAQAKADLSQFEATGDAPGGQQPAPGSDVYQIHYRDITVNLFNIGAQRTLDARFPMTAPSAEHEPQPENVYWTNHPECVTRTWIQEVSSPPAEGVERWFHIEFDLMSLVD